MKDACRFFRESPATQLEGRLWILAGHASGPRPQYDRVERMITSEVSARQAPVDQTLKTIAIPRCRGAWNRTGGSSPRRDVQHEARSRYRRDVREDVPTTTAEPPDLQGPRATWAATTAHNSLDSPTHGCRHAAQRSARARGALLRARDARRYQFESVIPPAAEGVPTAPTLERHTTPGRLILSAARGTTFMLRRTAPLHEPQPSASHRFGGTATC